MPQKKPDKIQSKQGTGYAGLKENLANAGDIISKALGLYSDPTALANANEIFPNKNPVFLPKSDVYSQAEVPELEKLVQQGILKKANNLFENRGYFMDRPGDIYDLGNMMQDSMSLTHPEALAHAGLLKSNELNDWVKILQDKGLMRVRTTPSHIGLELAHDPSNPQLEQIMALMEAKPKASMGLDVYHPINKKKPYAGEHFSKAGDALEFLYQFFK